VGLPAWAQVTRARRAHIERVVALLEEWAMAMRVPPGDRARWARAGWLHDALRDAPAADALAHGAAAADRAGVDGETDCGVLDAVRYHSLGYAGWDDVGRMLYLADYLEPGRAFDAGERRALSRQVLADRDAVLRAVARLRIEWVMRSGWALAPETTAFWNALVGPSDRPTAGR